MNDELHIGREGAAEIQREIAKQQKEIDAQAQSINPTTHVKPINWGRRSMIRGASGHGGMI
ncbi:MULTISPECIES: hypothetical protein [unclassified Tolypothrix]|uniref:hypothetical protein n=1 Tax=unclassified Tolypothrix TaxID=2649714 RepID=UPI0005EAAF49|nr:MULTISPECIES: hypothetical protein [unclassified Tolypothrix]BAY90772.1 hypothetical protein NIES3275_27890 [Microchaete diplosiphon NIES-3275]EKF04393.1 hypothetical protein FDUTEX481_02072 [Tolypothrix sp. PCC 7601]MBE9081029.1 hypothetical protein [Tolypothrix sp. LEGE 11397]UYD24905.1 hypothetical protein HGR01_26330 [Tolypothrix sp. PCC 7712]UYD32862.1 hypothetical protein HG267_28305 [Tolypothrix sp. PCC 7601]